MGSFWQIESGALRLASFGLAVVITSLLCRRANDWRAGRVLRPDESAVQAPEPLALGVVAALLAVAIFVTTAAAIVGRFPEWLADPEPVPMHLMHVPITIMAVLMIDWLAYHPQDKGLVMLSASPKQNGQPGLAQYSGATDSWWLL